MTTVPQTSTWEFQSHDCRDQEAHLSKTLLQCLKRAIILSLYSNATGIQTARQNLYWPCNIGELHLK